jgi:transaldolase/glucose-6-phosphate isomerase
MNPLQRLNQAGQSVWYDNVRRGLIANGELKRMIDAGEITGVTSNPTIFEKAIGGSSDYDSALMPLVEAHRSATEIYEALAIEDIRSVADLLRPVYDRTEARDGYVSIEVSPKLAHDAAATFADAKRLFAAIGRPNVMIKIPGTGEGIVAFENTIAEGINVNVTLLFSVENYEQVARAYTRGLQRRLDMGLPIDRVASVASFFISRVDSAVDGALEQRMRMGEHSVRGLTGMAAIANAKRVYQHFKEIFSEPWFAPLAAKGAQVQRPLWASTGTKNPMYSDVVYVDRLIGPNTVNTMPPQTVDAARDHATVEQTLERDVEDAYAALARLDEAGIDLAAITRKLQDDGLVAFEASFDSLIAAVERKREALLMGSIEHFSANVTPPTPAPGLVERIWSKDGSAWSDDPAAQAHIPTALGWLHTAEQTSEQIDMIESIAAEAREAGVRDVFLLGMGGSSLCPEVLRQTFGSDPHGSAPGSPRLTVLDTTHPDQIAEAERNIDLAKTWFVVSSKSGGTLETACLFDYFYARCQELDGDKAGRHFVVLTDPGTNAEKNAMARKVRRIVATPADVGGRYSALTPFGIVPAALLGIDVRELLDRAHTMMHACAACVPADENPGLWLGLQMGSLGIQGRDKVTIVVPPALSSMGLWVEQLIAESTGKEGKGLTPIADEPIGPPSAYGDDRVFVYTTVKSHPAPELDAKMDALEAAGQPVIRIGMADLLDIGGEFFRWEFATAVAGTVLRINAFDQPNVQESKDNTVAVLADWDKTGALPVVPSASPSDVAALIDGARPGDYVAIMAYVPIDAASDARLSAIRTAIRDRLKVAATVGYGPRFLHSTGQLHKGGPNTGVFVQIVDSPRGDLAIAGHKYSFATLIRAQGLGDYQSLETHGRRVVRIDLGADVAGGLDRLAAAVGAGMPTRG